jgi:hypothetical protein
MRRKDESAITENDQELQVRLVQTMITSAEDIFESDPTERYADPSYSSVTLMPIIRPSMASESKHPRVPLSSASATSFRAFWQSQVSSVPQVVSKCTEMIESNDWKTQIYYADARETDVSRAWAWLNSGRFSEVSGAYHRQQLTDLSLTCRLGVRSSG